MISEAHQMALGADRVENAIIAVGKFNEAEYEEFREWFNGPEARRRRQDKKDQEFKAHVRGIKKLRKGHKLRLTKNVYWHGTPRMFRGETVKLVKAKGCTKNIAVSYKRRGNPNPEEWKIPFDCVEDINKD